MKICRRWKESEIDRLKQMYNKLASVKEISIVLNRTPRAVEHRINKLKLCNSSSLKKAIWSKSHIGINLNELNGMWHGNKAGYSSLHEWVKRRKPKSKFCECCNINKTHDLANISGKYKRDINDYEWLCRGCHMHKDGRLLKLNGARI